MSPLLLLLVLFIFTFVLCIVFILGSYSPIDSRALRSDGTTLVLGLLFILNKGVIQRCHSTQLNEVARTVSTWADNNRMSLNTSKTKSLLIITLQKCSTLTNLALNVQIGGRYIEQVDHAKLLGVMIDSRMC